MVFDHLQVSPSNEKHTLPLVIVSETGGIAPAYHPVTCVPHWLGLVGDVGNSVPLAPMKRIQVEPDMNIVSQPSLPTAFTFLDPSLFVVYVEHCEGKI
jgi:hypothetical protein